MLNSGQVQIRDRAVSAIAAMMPALKAGAGPVLYGPNGKLMPASAAYGITRSAAKRAGSMKNWVPKRLVNRQQEALEREAMVDRSLDLAANDPNAAGVVDSFAHTVIGSGLMPQPFIDPALFPDMDKEKLRAVQTTMKNIYARWTPFADSGERMTAGEIQFLAICNLIKFGEYLALLPMLDDPVRPYRLAYQMLCPLRLKTPLDKLSTNIRDGIEMGEYGQPVAYWIKRSDATNPDRYLSDVSTNFLRVPARTGHRWNVLHSFIVKDAEQVRGVPFFAPAMKLFRDLNDYLDAELVSNIVTAAFSLFIETEAGDDPTVLAERLTHRTEEYPTPDGNTAYDRYQEMVPGMIMYGQTGQKPHPIAAARPGATFDPFIKIIKKALAFSLGMPYPVLFRDPESLNFAGFRSAMLDAWRVFMTYRNWIGRDFCQTPFTMLMEEAWLMGQLPEITDFYTDMYALTLAEWRGSPKGDIEPVQAVKADVDAINARIKTRAAAISERGEDWRAVFEQLEEEEQDLKEKDLTQEPSGEAQGGDGGRGAKDKDPRSSQEEKDKDNKEDKGNETD